MKALDLCCGAGGLSLGLTRAGFDVLGIDADADALDTHRRHVGPCEQGDLRTYSPPHAFDFVAGGPPCQPFSVAGKGLADEDERYLIPAFLRIARKAHARAVLLENVRGLVTRHPRVFRAVLDLFEAEYHTTWTILNAAHFGVPQSRERLFVIGFRDAADRARFRWPLPSHAPPGELFGEPHRTVRQALNLGAEPYRTGTIGNGGQGERLIDVDRPAPVVGVSRSSNPLDRSAPCVTATEQKSAMRGTQPMHRRRRASERLSEALASLDRPAPTIKANTWHEGTGTRASQRRGGQLAEALGALDRPSPTITAGGTEGGGGAEPIANRRQRVLLAVELEAAGLADRPATTVQADPRLAVAGHHDRQQNGAVRLTPEQCAILQDFPPGWTWTGNKSSQHRQIGNAVPPGLAEAVVRAVRAALG